MEAETIAASVALYDVTWSIVTVLMIILILVALRVLIRHLAQKKRRGSNRGPAPKGEGQDEEHGSESESR